MNVAPIRAARTAKPRRALALIRVSKDRDGNTSPEVQRHAIETYAAQENVHIVDWVEGVDEARYSGSRRNSAWWPKLSTAIDRAESGEVDTILVWKFSRTARNRLRWAVAIDRMDVLGGEIISVTEPMESRTASGKFARGVLGEMNAYQADLIGETWKEAHQRRIRSGRPANGKPRFGYTYEKEAGFTPDPIAGPTLRDAYVRYIGGESVYSLVKWLNDGATRPVGGYGATGDGLWSDRTLRRVMDSGFAAGLLRINTGTAAQPEYGFAPGAHQALITDAEWQAYREARGRRSKSGRIERSEYLLSGMVRCACGSTMNAGQFGANHTAKYRCKAAHEKRRHDGGYVTANLVEEYVMQWVRERQEKARAARDAAKTTAPRPRPIADPSRALRARIAETEAEIDRVTRRAMDLDVPRDIYHRQLHPLSALLERLKTEERSVAVRATKPLVLHSVDVLDDWESFTIPQRREMLRAVIKFVEVTPGRPRATFRIEPQA